VAGAAAVYDRHASFVRYEGQQGIGLALRKEVLRRRGAIAHAFVRPPGPKLDELTRAELGAILERLALLRRPGA
jgi:4-hydroxy-tetrahydrodipicolinate synthase